jgi:hypothetical protein
VNNVTIPTNRSEQNNEEEDSQRKKIYKDGKERKIEEEKIDSDKENQDYRRRHFKESEEMEENEKPPMRESNGKIEEGNSHIRKISPQARVLPKAIDQLNEKLGIKVGKKHHSKHEAYRATVS